MTALAIALVLPLAAFAQSGGVLPEWEIKKRVEGLTAEVERIKPVLEQVDPARWSDSSAAAVFTPRFQACQGQVASIQAAVQKFLAQPEKLSVALELLFRVNGLAFETGVLSQGVRRYQNPAVADLLDGMVRETSTTRDILQQHVQDLAALREKEFEVADKEAQRCRAQLAKPATGGRK